MRPKVVALNPPAREAEAPDELSRLALQARAQAEVLDELVGRLERDSRLQALSRRLSRDLAWHGAEDLLQSTLERVVRGIRSYRGSGSVVGWAAQIMRNACFEWRRREASEDEKVVELGHEIERGEQPDPLQALTHRELERVVLQTWQRRSADPDVRIFWDRTYVGLSVEQIMRRTGHPRSTVYHMLKKGGLKFLREYQRRCR
jgi:RNA polymerase sigma factor (sigma-70 family)